MTAIEALEDIGLTDEERLPYIAESVIWETRITPALVALGPELLPLIMRGPEAIISVLRVFFEGIYVLGYQEGAKQKPVLPTFVCQEDLAKGE